jgi:hypothetical protein
MGFFDEVGILWSVNLMKKHEVQSLNSHLLGLHIVWELKVVMSSLPQTKQAPEDGTIL